MKKIATIAAIAALTTLTACGSEAEVTAPETEVTAPEAEKTGGPCGDGRELRENEVCP
jgi:predicted small lipoprotein YifL